MLTDTGMGPTIRKRAVYNGREGNGKKGGGRGWKGKGKIHHLLLNNLTTVKSRDYIDKPISRYQSPTAHG